MEVKSHSYQATIFFLVLGNIYFANSPGIRAVFRRGSLGNLKTNDSLVPGATKIPFCCIKVLLGSVCEKQGNDAGHRESEWIDQ